MGPIHTHTHTHARSLDASTPTGKLRALGVLHKKMEGGEGGLINKHRESRIKMKEKMFMCVCVCVCVCEIGVTIKGKKGWVLGYSYI